jgi:hypothetical protein
MVDKLEIRISNFETISKSKSRMVKTRHWERLAKHLGFWSFGFVSDFDSQVSKLNP